MSTGTFSFPYGPSIIAIGRDAECPVRLNAVGVSRHHAQIICMADGPHIFDLGSSAGTRINGVGITESILKDSCVLSIGVIDFKVRLDGEFIRLERLPSASQVGSDTSGSATITIGRDESCDFVLDHPSVSRRHCVVTQNGTQFSVVDNGSANGTRINGRKIDSAPLNNDDVLDIGPFRIQLRNGHLESLADSGRVGIEAVNLSVKKNGHRILSNIDLSIRPGEFVALLGPSGAGKTTLARALIGDCTGATGTILYNGVPLVEFYAACSSSIGYVSQHVLLRPELTVWETLCEQAAIRLPPDSDKDERSSRIETVADLLDIRKLFERRIAKLSGGEARRVHLANELLSSPAVIVLDEPLAGLDSDLAARFMVLFKSLAAQGHTILLTTHRLEQLHKCDRLLFVNNGVLVFAGTFDEALEKIDVADISEAYEKIRSGKYAAGHKESVSAVAVPHVRQNRKAIRFSQMPLLFTRYCKVLRRDRVNLLLLLLQPPLIVLLLSLVYSRGMEELPVSFFFCLTLATIWTGGVNAVREVSREWELFLSESRAGLSTMAYLAGKASVFIALALIQATLFSGMTAVVFAGCPFTIVSWSIAAAGMISGTILGFLISSFSGNVNRALTLLPLVFIPQIFFSGILLPFDIMPSIGELLSQGTVTRPVFSLYKELIVLDTPFFQSEWLTLLLINIVSIILSFIGIALGRRRFSGR